MSLVIPRQALCGGIAVSSASQRSDTTVRVVTPAKYSARPQLIAELTIDAADSPDGELGTAIGDVLWAHDGKVWVTKGGIGDPRTAIWIFDSTGKFLQAVSRLGRGPGEFQFPRGLAQLPDGRVVLRDARLQNILTIFRPNGSYDTTWSFATVFSGGAQNPRPIADTSGIIWLEYAAIGAGMRPGQVSAPSSGDRGFARISAQGRIIDTVPYPELPDVNPHRMRVDPTYWPRASAKVSPLGYLGSYVTSRYSVDLRIPARARDRVATWRPGDSVVSLRRTVSTVSISAAERKDREDFLKSAARGGVDIADVPRNKPPLREVIFDPTGRLWVGSFQASEHVPPSGPSGVTSGSQLEAWRQPVAYDVVEPSGQLIGTVVFPLDSYPYAIRGDRAWCLQRTEEGRRLVRYRIIWE